MSIESIINKGTVPQGIAPLFTGETGSYSPK